MNPTIKQSFIYIIHAQGTDLIKIGISRDPEKRQRQLQTGSGYELQIIYQCVGTRRLEAHLHAQIRACRRCGEWFKLTRFQIQKIRNGELSGLQSYTLKELLSTIEMGWWDISSLRTAESIRLRWRDGGQVNSFIFPSLASCHVDTLMNCHEHTSRRLLNEWLAGHLDDCTYNPAKSAKARLTAARLGIDLEDDQAAGYGS